MSSTRTHACRSDSANCSRSSVGCALVQIAAASSVALLLANRVLGQPGSVESAERPRSESVLRATVPQHPSAAPKLVIITVERRIAPRTPERQYRAFMQSRREQLLAALFDAGTLHLAAGDIVAFTADGVDLSDKRRMLDGFDNDVESVGRALDQMLALPGRPEQRLWLGQISETLDRSAFDDSLRVLVTCPLVNAPGVCSERSGAGRLVGARSYSRALLTMPSTLRLALDEIDRRQLPKPREVFWVWIQVGSRTNEINGMVEEIRRDFSGLEETRVLNYWDSRRSLLSDSYIPWVSDSSATGAGGIAAWSIASISIRAQQLDTRALPILIAETVHGSPNPIDSTRTIAERMFLPSDPLWEVDDLRLAFSGLPIATLPPPLFLSASAEARCKTADGSVIDRTPPFSLVIAPNKRSAALESAGLQTIKRFAEGCGDEGNFVRRLVASLIGNWKPNRTFVLALSSYFTADSDGRGLPGTAWNSVRERTFVRQSASVVNWSMFVGTLAIVAASALGLAWLLRYLFLPTDYELVVGDDSDRTIGGMGRRLSVAKLKGTNTVPIPVYIRHVRGKPRSGAIVLSIVPTTLSHNVPLRSGEVGDVLHVRYTMVQNWLVGRLFSFTGKVPTLQKETIHIADIDPTINPSSIDFGKVKTNVKYELSIKSRIEASSTRLVRIPGVERYTPLYFQVGTAQRASPPVIQLHLSQAARYRGISRRDLDNLGEDHRSLGGIQIDRPLVEGFVARPVDIRIDAQAFLRAAGADQATPVKCSFLFEYQGRREAVLELPAHDQPEATAPLFIKPVFPEGSNWRSAELRIELIAEWKDAHDQSGTFARLDVAPVTAWIYQADVIFSVALDIGTSATRMLIDRQGYHVPQLVGLPGDLLYADTPEFLKQSSAYRDAVQPGGELDSAILADAGCERLLAAGCLALERYSMQQQGMFRDSLKGWLLHEPNGEHALQVQQLFAQSLEQLFAPSWGSSDTSLPVCDFRGYGGLDRESLWRNHSITIPGGAGYVLVLTVPDSYSMGQRQRLESLFQRWSGCLRAVTLREAEAAVLYYAQHQRQSAVGTYTLVVDVGAGTVDLAMVQTSRNTANELTAVEVIATAVSFAAGDAANDALSEHLGGHPDTRTIREKKEQIYSSVGSDEFADEQRLFTQSPAYANLMRNAIDIPLQQLVGRLALVESSANIKATSIILTGRGSLLVGLERYLAESLSETTLSDSGTLVQTNWNRNGPLDRVSFDLKQAVVEGAVMLLSSHRAHFASSSDFLRDHLLLVGIQGTDPMYGGVVVAPARTSRAQLMQGITIPGRTFVEARLVYSAVLPRELGGTDPDIDWGSIWRDSSTYDTDQVSKSAARTSWLVQQVSMLQWSDESPLTVRMRDDNFSVEY